MSTRAWGCCRAIQSSMSEPSPPLVRRGDGSTVVIAVIGWDGDRGAARALLQAVIAGRHAQVFLAELRDWPEHDLTQDVEAFADVAWETLTSALFESVDPHHVEWYLRHGQFSTYDPAGPESITAVDLTWQGDRWRRIGGSQAYHLVDDATTSALLDGLDEVDAALQQVAADRLA